MVLCILAGNFDPFIFVGVMPLGTWRIFVNQLKQSKFFMSIFYNEITASDAGPDIIRSHLFQKILRRLRLENIFLFFLEDIHRLGIDYLRYNLPLDHRTFPMIAETRKL